MSDDAWLQHMLSAAREALERTAGYDVARFVGDRDKQLAVQHLPVLIGEAAVQVPGPTRARFPALPWRDIVAMRNRLVHRYFSVRLELVWQAVETDLPTLATELQAAGPQPPGASTQPSAAAVDVPTQPEDQCDHA